LQPGQLNVGVVWGQDGAWEVVLRVTDRGDDQCGFVAADGARQEPLQLVGAVAMEDARVQSGGTVAGFHSKPTWFDAVPSPFDPELDERGPA
jgi:hypothetical protein